jgi:hypothetical protein
MMSVPIGAGVRRVVRVLLLILVLVGVAGAAPSILRSFSSPQAPKGHLVRDEMLRAVGKLPP